MRLHSGKNASWFPEKREKLITAGCFKTAQILFEAATNHILAMFTHFKSLGPENSSPYKSGTKQGQEQSNSNSVFGCSTNCE